MTSIKFFGGVNDIGGNKFLVQDKDTKIFMDFGMSFSQEGQYFSQFLGPRTSNSLIDLFELGILPKIKGLYRRDYAKHMGFDGREETDIDGILLTHAHVDHCAYINYLREDIPIYCTEESKLIMQNFDDTGSDQYLTLKQRFQVYENKKGEMSRMSGEKTEIPRDVKIIKPDKEFSIDSIGVKPLLVDHSIPGVCGFVLHTSNGTIANTADLRFHGRRAKDTEHFVNVCGNSDLNVLLCEGTRVNKTSSTTEYEVESKVSEIIDATKGLVICGYPIRDLDRLESFYLAAKASHRYLVIDLKQAYLLKLFAESDSLKGKYPAPTDSTLRIYIQRGSWGLIDKDINHFSQKQLYKDYRTWQREFLDYPNAIDYRDIQKNPKDYVFYCSDFRLQDLIDIKPQDNSVYIRSLTEPFNTEMEIKEDQVKNWFVRFGVLKRDQDWHQIHVSGHGDGEQIKRVIGNSNAKSIIPIHTMQDEYHKKWHPNVITVTQNDSFDL